MGRWGGKNEMRKHKMGIDGYGDRKQGDGYEEKDEDCEDTEIEKKVKMEC
jgi:hypothetical protein